MDKAVRVFIFFQGCNTARKFKDRMSRIITTAQAVIMTASFGTVFSVLCGLDI